MGKERAAEQTQQQRGRHHDQEVAAEGLEERLTVIRAAAHLQDRTVGQPHRGDRKITLLIFRNAQPDESRQIAATIQRRGVELNPIFWQPSATIRCPVVRPGG